MVDARKFYGRAGDRIAALDGVSLEFLPGTFTAIMGPSGSGKSTLLQCAAGLEPGSTRDRFCWPGWTRRGPRRARWRACGAIRSASFPVVQPAAVVDRAPERGAAAAAGGQAPSTRSVAAVLADLDLSDRAGHLPSELSGGQQQRVAIARALITRPSVVFADEPTGAFDTRTSREVLALLRRMVTDHGLTVLLVTHDPVAAGYATVSPPRDQFGPGARTVSVRLPDEAYAWSLRSVDSPTLPSPPPDLDPPRPLPPPSPPPSLPPPPHPAGVFSRSASAAAAAARPRGTSARHLRSDGRSASDATQSGRAARSPAAPSRSPADEELALGQQRFRVPGEPGQVRPSGADAGQQRRSADRRTQKSASAAQRSMTGHDRGSGSAISPATLTASPSTSAQVPDWRSSRSTVARSPAPSRGAACVRISTTAIRRSWTGARRSATAQAAIAAWSTPVPAAATLAARRIFRHGRPRRTPARS